jgi:hypothetical protein
MLYLILGTVEGSKIHVENISIDPCNSATITYKLITSTGTQSLTHVVEGEQYRRWGTDDTILYHILCLKHGLQYKPYVEPEFFEEVMVSKNDETGQMIYETIRYPNPKYVPTAPTQ